MREVHLGAMAAARPTTELALDGLVDRDAVGALTLRTDVRRTTYLGVARHLQRSH
jgi:hypothetical protein